MKKRVLISAPMKMADAEDEAEGLISEGVGDSAEIVRAHSLDWNSIRAAEGGWDQAYRWAAKSFDILVMCPVRPGVLSRGVYTMVRKFLAVNKRVAVAESGTLAKVSAVYREGDDWKGGFGGYRTEETT